MPKGLVILHIDGLGYDYLREALQQGRMPFVASLLTDEDYELLRYRSGLPSTTPYVQAGLLYGDNTEIPSFRWWDKQSGVPVSFGGRSSFSHVAHKYFRHCDPLTRGGVAIATCYPAQATRYLRLRNREHDSGLPSTPFSYRNVLVSYAMNPLHVADWLRRGVWQIWKANWEYWRAKVKGHPTAKMYVISDMLEEILLHQLTRFAVAQAMAQNFPVIYGAFYAYDETAHAFGPEADYSFRILRHIDNTIRRVARLRKREGTDARDYELVILSDHGQVQTVPFEQKYGMHLADLIEQWLPNFVIEEFRGKKIPRRDAIDGHVALMYSGGLAHLYFQDISWRLQYNEIAERCPGLIERVARTPGVGLLLLRDGADNVVVTQDKKIRFNPDKPLPRAVRDLLARYDEPEIVAQQLHRLNGFERSGDMILLGEFTDHHQVNFEAQVGGHGAVGGAQQHPFILVKREWKFKTGDITDASQLYPQLKRLRDRMLK